MYMPTLCMCVFQRPHNLEQIKIRLNNQKTNPNNFQLYIWNNTKTIKDQDMLDKYFYDAFFNVKVFSGLTRENHGSQARFWLPLKPGASDPIIFFDDDQLPHTIFVDYMFNEYLKRPKSIQSWKSRRFTKESYWSESDNAKYGDLVDYVGTGGMVLEKSIFFDPRLLDIPEKFRRVEDLWLSYIARQFYNKDLVRINRRLDKLKDGQDQHKKFKLKNVKEDCFKDLRERGWTLLKDLI